MEELKLRIRKTGLSLKEFAKLCKIRYNTLIGYLNEFAEMPEHVKENIDNTLTELGNNE